jgi:hypothetical protein
MKQMVNITGINPVSLALLNGAEVSARLTFSETSIHIQIERPPPPDSSVEHLRQEFAKIELHFSGKSLEIMQYLLATEEGKTHREKLKADIWAENYPANPCVRRAIHRLNAGLAEQNFGYTVCGNLKGSKGVYRLVPIEK